MFEFFRHLFDPSGFPARWDCGEWTPAHGWLHIISDIGVWSAYVAIPCVLAFFVVRRKDVPFSKIFWLFGAFILACGSTHLMEAIIFWIPLYRLAGLIKLFTAMVSWATVIALVAVTPKALAMRSPEALEQEISKRKQAETQLQRALEQLEIRIQERTSQLASANTALQAEIEERKRIEETLRDQGEQLRITLASIGDAVIVTDAQGRVTALNAPAKALTGREDALGKPLEEVFEIANEYTRQKALNPVLRVLQEGTVVGLANDSVLIAKDGTARPIEDSAAPIKDEMGKTFGVVLVFRDVTERRRMEQWQREYQAQLEQQVQAQMAKLRATEEHFRLLVEGTKDYAIFMLDGGGHVVSWNPGAERIHGYLADEILNQHFSRFFLPDDVALGRPGHGLQVAIDEGRYEDEALRVRKDGTQFWANVIITPLRGENGNLRGFCKITRDITARRNAEENSRRKDEFLAMLAHELRNPLAPILNAVHVMQLSGTTDLHLRWCHDILLRQTRHLARLVDDLLDVSRITRGRVQLRRERLALAEIIERAVETSQPLINAKRHQLSLALPAQPLYLHADSTRLAQVFANLLNNSAKYMEVGGKIWLTAEREGDATVVVRVRDEGVGIAPEMLSKVFELFTQVARSLDRSEGGLGIGLSLVQSLVKMHDGNVTASSEGPGKGSEFVVRLPALPEDPSPQAVVSKTSGEPAKTPLRILVVDDNVDTARLLAMLLCSDGHDAWAVFEGIGALEEARARRPDVILVDLGLPDIDGFEVCRRLRQEAMFKKTLIAALTGYGQDEDRRRSKEAGFDAHLVKPVATTHLQELLAQAFRRQESGGHPDA